MNGLSPSGLHDEFITEGIVDADTDDPNEPQEVYPTFFPPDLIASLPSAKKSLKILRAAQADHPILHSCMADSDVVWVWTEADVHAVWSRTEKPAPEAIPEEGHESTHSDGTSRGGQRYKPGLAGFRDFDLEPGSHLVQSGATSGLSAFSTSGLRAFLAVFPESLPAICPTLSQLTSLIFSPLVNHTRQLSSDLLLIFLSPSSTLHFQTHLVLLRSYLLLTSHSFRSRLTTALFSHSMEPYPNVMAPTRGFTSPAILNNGSARQWAVGLASYLTNRDTWPPGGADLSFLLRTVIVDSLESGYERSEGLPSPDSVSQRGRETVFEEAEFRLGFAIRDLPIGPGRDRWLNPLCA
jgi:hypothetical protein